MLMSATTANYTEPLMAGAVASTAKIGAHRPGRLMSGERRFTFGATGRRSEPGNQFGDSPKVLLMLPQVSPVKVRPPCAVREASYSHRSTTVDPLYP